MKTKILLIIAIFINIAISQPYKTLGTWDANGVPNYLEPSLDYISNALLTNLKGSLPESQSVAIHHPQYITSAARANIEVKEQADVYVTYLMEGAAYKNALGFYTYPKDSIPTSINDIKNSMTLIFPNSSQLNSGGGLIPGMKVKIGRFNPNTVIGWFIVSNGWNPNTQLVENGYWKFFSNSNFNPETNPDLKKHNVLLKDVASGKIILGFEDVKRENSGCDHDFNDIVFFITANPVTSIDTTNIPLMENNPPNPTINKTDGKIFAPDSGSNNTYTIHYANKGNSKLLSTVLVDTLPTGVQYVSCTGANSCSEISTGVVKWVLGTLNPKDSGSVTVTVKINSSLPEYINKAMITGKDSINHIYSEFAQDISVKDTTSPGSGAGVESNGDKAEALLRRTIMLENGWATKLLNDNRFAKISGLPLEEIVPLIGPRNTQSIVSTPFDIMSISNAKSAFARDYILKENNIDRRIASIFSTTTEPSGVYNHSMQVCERLANYELSETKLIDIDNSLLYLSKLVNKEKKYIDYSITFSVYEVGNYFWIDTRFAIDEFIPKEGTSTIYNFQIWSCDEAFVKELAQQTIDKFKTLGNVAYVNISPKIPEIIFEKAAYNHLGKISMDIINYGSPQTVSLKSYYYEVQGGPKKESLDNFLVPTGKTNRELKLGSGTLFDAKVFVTSQELFRDEIYVSGGAFTFFKGETTTITDTITNSFTNPSPTQYPDSAFILSGGAKIQGKLGNFVTCYRSLNPSASPLDLSDYKSIKLTLKGNVNTWIRLEELGIQNFNYHMIPVNLQNNEQTIEIPFSDFQQYKQPKTVLNPKIINKISFDIQKGNNQNINDYNIEVKNIVFIKKTGNEPVNPYNYSLSQNYPNPFNPSTTIEYSVKEAGKVVVKIFDLLGREVRTLVNENKQPNKYYVNFNSTGLSSGIYLYSIQSGSYNQTRKMVILK